ncbi:hypothetical protein BH18ACI5_BH18ACI5_03570 [soil metagenome]
MRQLPVILIVSVAATLHAQALLTETLLTEVGRVERDMQQVTTEEERGGAEIRLARAADAARKGRIYLSLHELSGAWRLQAASAFAARLRDSVKTADDFRREWKSVGEPHPPSPALSLPLAIAAIVTASEAAAPATYRASLPFAEDAGVGSGVYYLGDADAAMRFGAFSRSLTFTHRGRRPPLRSIAPELERFETEVLKHHNQADAAARRPYIQISVGLKIARERDTSGDYGAALLQYLLARYQHALLLTTAPATDVSGRIKVSQAGMRDADHSIGELFLQMALAQLESSDPKGSIAATAIMDVVIPEYIGIVKR